MNRPILPTVAIAFMAAFSLSVFADTDCGPMTRMGQICTAHVDMSKLKRVSASQSMSQWCWAASISTVFAYNGHPLNQSKIVQATYGRIINLPSGNGWTLAKNLNRSWTDDDGDKFTSTLTAAYDSMAGVHAINNAWIINELDEERPFVIGARTHAMVAVSITYVRDGLDRVTSIRDIKVFDPWPGKGVRSLELDEVVPRDIGGNLVFAATVEIE